MRTDKKTKYIKFTSSLIIASLFLSFFSVIFVTKAYALPIQTAASAAAPGGAPAAAAESAAAGGGAADMTGLPVTPSALATILLQVVATAFKTSLQAFARQVAHDTAVWVASGGKGQKPLFITEGWGAYVKNAGDAALGDFIDGVGSEFGVDLCQPDFRVRLAITAGLDYQQPRQVRCSFSQIMTNWQSAINNASFAFDYRESLRPGANDISFALIMADQRNSYVATAAQNAAKEAETTGLWKNIKNTAGKILTPGTMVADKMRDAAAKADIGLATFTNSVADVVQEFLNTLVSELLKNLQKGVFSGSGDNNNRSGFSPDLSGLAALFNPNSSPIVNGIAGARLAYSNLIEGQTKVGAGINILLKLSTCSDAAKANPGPTDCVMDALFANAVKSKKYVTDLDPSIKNRLFAPKINQKASLETTFSSRAISIMREYRIVPVGWEFAAQVIKNSTVYNSLTLNDVMNCFYGAGQNNCNTDDFKDMVDPYWVLKAPETFCRRIGYTGFNIFAKEQNSGIQRSQECVDEQQCLQEDGKGNCIDYGYCTEERRAWDIGKSCESKYNTCQTYKSRSGLTSNWLKDTLDFENCSAQNAGCRSYATNFNYQSKEWNGDIIPVSGLNIGKLTNYSRFLDSSRIEVTLDPSWQVLENHTVSKNGRLALGSECNRANCGAISGCSYNETGKYCSMEAGTAETGTGCIVPAGGISCYVDSCYDSADLLKALNPGFETQEAGSNPGNAKFWTDELSYNNLNNRHYRSAGSGLSGYGLRAVSANTPADLITSLPNIPLDQSASYKLKFAIRGTVSQGSIVVAMVAGDSPYNTPNSLVALGGQSFVTSPGAWTEVEMPVINGNFSTGTIAIVTPIGTIADVALDNFELVKLKSSCSAAGVKLFSAAQTIELDGSPLKATNIYFNRNAQTCSGNAFGCSQFIRTKADLGNNLLYNGGLEYGNAGWVSQMAANMPKKPVIDRGAAIVYGSMVAPEAVIEVEPNSYYSFGFDGAQTAAGSRDGATLTFSPYNTQANRSIGAITLHQDTDCTGVSNNNIVRLYNLPEGENLARKSCHFRTPSDTHYIKFKIDVDKTEIKVDNLKLEKVSYPNFAATPYSAYDPSAGHSGEQIANLKQAPDYFGCYKNEGGAWPTTAGEINSIIAKRAPECGNFADVCRQAEVGCELYKPVNGDPEIPGIVDGLDLCPGECSGYQVYKQEPTNFIVDSSFKQFIADKNAKYCSAAYAGCDEFTNLDEVGRGAEKKEYYVSFKTCQRPSADDASYYAWEGSDITGYQLKAFTLKKSNSIDPENGNQGFAPCTNLGYNADGGNVCQDSNSVAAIDARAAAGICAKEDMAANSDCRELYGVDGNVHYRLLSKAVTVSDNCHPYRRTQTQTNVGTAQTDCVKSHGWWKDATKECIYMAIPAEGKVCSAEVKGCRAYTGNRGNNVRNVLTASDFASDSASDTLWRDRNDAGDGIMISSEATYPGGNSLSNKVNAIDGTGQTNNVIKHQVSLLKNHTYTLSFWAKGNASFNPDKILLINDGADKDKFSATRLAGDNPLAPRVMITPEWKRYDLGPVFVTWEPTENDYLSFNLPGGAKIYLDNVVLRELNNNIYAIENSWYTPVSCDNKLDDADGKKAIANNACQDASTGRCSNGEMLGCAAYKDRAGAVWYLRSFNSLCRRAAVGCEALLATHNSESALPETFNAGAPGYDDVTVPADNLVYLVNDKKHSCSSADKGCNAFGLPILDKWDAVTGYQTVFLKNNPTRYATDLCKHSELWCEEYASSNSLEYFKDPHGKTCDYSDVPGQGKGWFKTGTNEHCIPDSAEFSINGGGTNMSFGTGYQPAAEKIQPYGPYSDTLGGGAPGVSTREPDYAGFAGNCPQTSSGCSEYIDPDPTIYTNYLSAKDVSQPDKPVFEAKLVLTGYTLYDFTDVAPFSATCPIFRPFGVTSTMYYFGGAAKQPAVDCSVTVKSADKFGKFGGLIDEKSKVSKAGVYYALSGSVDGSSCNGNVDFKSGCILMNSRNSIDYNSTTTADRAIKYLTYDAVRTNEIWNDQIINNRAPNPVSPQMPVSGWQADSNLIVKAGANRTCEKWLQCSTYQKTGDSSQSYRFDNQDQCLNFGVCNFRNADGSCGRWETPDIKNIDKDNFAPNMTGFTIPNNLPVAAMDQFGNSASVPNGNFESSIGGTSEPLGWIMNASSSDLNGDGWKSYKYAMEGKQQYLRFDSAYLAANSVYAVISEPIDIAKESLYALDFWINTQDLKPETAAARIFITSEAMQIPAGVKFDIAKSNIQIPKDSGVKVVLMDEQYWITSDNLKLDAEMPWTEKTVLISAANKDTIKLKLMNFDDEAALKAARPNTTTGIDLNLDAAPGLNYTNCYDLQDKLDAAGDPIGKIVGRPDFTSPCNITGSSLFDNISLKAALRIMNDSGLPLGTEINDANLPATKELIARSCRAYPAADARSCQYSADGNFYYGWYGYCLMEDPDNPGQCLQWYPIDQLKGDVVDEYSGGYADRLPLYYCAEVKKNEVKAQVKQTGAGVGGNFSELASDIPGVSTVLGKLINPNGSGKAVPFILSDPSTVRLFRYPMLTKFGVNAIAAGVGVQYGHMGAGAMFFIGTMEKYYSCLTAPGNYCKHQSHSAADITDMSAGANNPFLSDIIEKIIQMVEEFTTLSLDAFLGNKLKPNSVWGGWGSVVAVVLGNVGIGIPFAGWDLVEDKIMNGESGNGQMVEDFLRSVMGDGAYGDSSVMGAKIVIDDDQKYASKFTDPNSELIGNILGVVWGVQLGSAGSAYVANIDVSGSYNAYYCTKVVQVATATGLNKAWVNRVSQASQFTFLSSDKLTSDTTSPNSPASPDNFDQECRVEDGTPRGKVDSDYKFFTNPYCLNVTGALDPNDIDPTNLGYQFDGYNADYKPFGAVVPPQTDLQNPYLWDTYSVNNSTDLSRQPLYWEPPTLSGSAPYQARMGQPETVPGVQNLFAKSYAAWKWVTTDPTDPATDESIAKSGYYQAINKKSSAADYAAFIWDVPKDYCPNAWITSAYAAKGYVRDMNDRDHYCLIPPEVITMKVNDSVLDTSVDASHPAKLDFTVRVDRDQLPLTSYTVEWGDGNLNNTSVTGVKLRARANPDNPFTLYHLYDYQKVREAAGTCTAFSGASTDDPCYLHYCAYNSVTKETECFVKINVTVTDNWRAEGNKVTSFEIQVK